MALGLVVLLLLSAYPGEPFDYSKPDGGRAEREAAIAGNCKGEEEEEDLDKVEVRVAADGCGSTMGSSSSSGNLSSTTTMTTTTTMTSVRHRCSHSKRDSKSTRGRNGSSSSSSSSNDGHEGQHAKAEALHRLLVQEDRVWQRLQHLPPAVRGMLGLSEDGVRLAVRQAGGSAGRVRGLRELDIGWNGYIGILHANSFLLCLTCLRTPTPTGAAAFVDHGRLSCTCLFFLSSSLSFVLPYRCVFFSLYLFMKNKILTCFSFSYLSPIIARIDLVFYLLAFSALVYVLNMEYGHVATRLFTRFFPKEAAVLGV